MDPTTATALQYGALGLTTLAAVAAVKTLWRSLQEERAARDTSDAAYQKKIDECNAAHKAEMAALVERLIEASATMTSEYHKLAERMTTVQESLMRRLDRTDRPRRIERTER